MYVGRVPNVDEIREKSGKFCLEEKAEKESTFMEVKKIKSSQGNSKCQLCFTILYLLYFRPEFTALEKDAIKNDMVLVSVKHS